MSTTVTGRIPLQAGRPLLYSSMDTVEMVALKSFNGRCGALKKDDVFKTTEQYSRILAGYGLAEVLIRRPESAKIKAPLVQLKIQKQNTPTQPAVISEERWSGFDVVCIASGPSLTQADCDAVKNWRSLGNNRRVIVINSSYKLAPWADVLYACDLKWWNTNYQEALSFKNEKWTLSGHAAKKFKALRKAGKISTGGNSGHQSLALAGKWGARKIILLGYDFQKTNGKAHWHPDHPKGMGNGGNFKKWASKIEVLGQSLKNKNIRIINCTRKTALNCFERTNLEDELCRTEEVGIGYP